MRREELIRKNRESFSNLRKWSMQRGYYSGEQLETNMKGVMLAGLIGTGAIASASTAGAIPAHALLGFGAATAIAAKSARVGTFVATIAHKTSLHKLIVQAAFRMGDRARAIFQRTMDGIFKVHPDITRTRELADSLAKIKFQADGMLGVAIDKTTEFNPKTNIFLPVTKLDSNSPLFAKNKQIYSEIVEMINNGRLTKQEIQELNAFTKGATTFSLDKSCHYDKNVNYAVLVGKLENVMEKVCSIQDNRESLKIDGADAIEKIERREDRKRVVKPVVPIAAEIKVLEEMVGNLTESVVTTDKEPIPVIGDTPLHVRDVEEHRMAAIRDMAALAPEGMSVKNAIENLQKSDKTPDQTIK